MHVEAKKNLNAKYDFSFFFFHLHFWARNGKRLQNKIHKVQDYQEKICHWQLCQEHFLTFFSSKIYGHTEGEDGAVWPDWTIFEGFWQQIFLPKWPKPKNLYSIDKLKNAFSI